MVRVAACVLVLSVALACGSSGGSAPTAPLPVALPQVPNHGGHVIAHMKLVTITFKGDPNQAEIQAFGDWLVGSSWLSSVGSEYGVGAGTHVAKLVLDYAPPAVLGAGDIETYLAAGITSKVFPPPDDDTIYVAYYPSTKPSGLGCDGPWWGHRTVSSPVRFTYAAIPACPSPSLFAWSPIETLEQNASHEIIEAATDPDRDGTPTYAITDPADPFLYMGSEVGDLCVGLVAQESGFFAQRAWSNAAAAAGRSPCVPAPPGDVAFGLSPASTAPLRIAAGASAPVVLTAWASGPRPPWNAGVAAFPGFQASLSPTGTLDGATVSAGDHVTLTVSVPGGAQPGQKGILVVDSLTVGANMVATSGPYEWPILVEVP